MNIQVFIRCGAVVVAGITAIAAIQAVARHDRDSVTSIVARSIVGDSGEATALRHCNELGLAAENDTGCAAIWLANRTRFLEGRKTPASVTGDHVGEGAP